MAEMRERCGSELKDIEQHLSSATHLISKGEYESALKELRGAHEILKRVITNSRARGHIRRLWLSVLTGLMHTLSALQRHDEALKYANVACRSFRQNPLCKLLRAQILVSLRRYKEATRDIKRAMEGYKGDANAMLRLASIAFEVGEYSLSRDCCMDAIAQDESIPESYLILSESLRRMGKLDEALNTLLTALSKGLHDIRLKMKAAELYYEVGEIRKAVEMLESATDQSDDGRLSMALAELHIELGNYSKTVEYCASALGKMPNEPLLLDMLAFAQLQLGNLDEAIQALARLVHIAPSDTFTRFRLATLYHQKGAYANAMREYQRILAMEPDGVFTEQAQAAIQQLDELQLEQIFELSSTDPVFRAKLFRDPVEALRERGFLLSEAAIEMIRNANMTNIRGRQNMTPA